MASLSSAHYLTSDDLNKIFQNTRKSVNYLREFDDSSTNSSSDSSFWESSKVKIDSTVTDYLSSEQSGSDPSEQLGSEPSELLGENSCDSDQASESNFTTQRYNLCLCKRERPSFSQVLSKVVSTVMQVHLKVIIVIHTKIARTRLLSVLASEYGHNVENSKKVMNLCFKAVDKDHKCYKSCFLIGHAYRPHLLKLISYA